MIEIRTDKNLPYVEKSIGSSHCKPRGKETVKINRDIRGEKGRGYMEEGL